MPYDFPPIIEQLIREQLSSGQYATADDVLLDALQSLVERKADLAAVQEAIVDMEGDDKGESLENVANDIRSKYGWSAE